MRKIQESVRDRLRNLAREQQTKMEFLVNRYMAERFLHRLAKSDLVSTLIVHGATAIRLRELEWYRPTVGIDLLDLCRRLPPELIDAIASVARTESDEADAVEFDVAALRQEISTRRRSAAEHIRLRATVGTANIPVNIYLMGADSADQKPEWCRCSCLLRGFSTFQVQCQSVEMAAAGKLAHLVEFGGDSTRVRDIFDLWKLATSQLDQSALLDALRRTFATRDAERLLHDPHYWEIVWSDAFVTQEIRRIWANWIATSGPGFKPPPIREVVTEVGAFALPLLHRMREEAGSTLSLAH